MQILLTGQAHPGIMPGKKKKKNKNPGKVKAF